MEVRLENLEKELKRLFSITNICEDQVNFYKDQAEFELKVFSFESVEFLRPIILGCLNTYFDGMGLFPSAQKTTIEEYMSKESGCKIYVFNVILEYKIGLSRAISYLSRLDLLKKK